ncbi:MAG TPA: hypothetical protein VMS64_16550 [Candidatus Methylomirabilis sp.]|nr:hypothetical protein [Candidatus Methylomirabilis sp.]
MNFFGHATVASWDPSATAAFALGAMLPDFIAMSGAASMRPAHEETRRGVALHHATDEVFHAAPDFIALMGRARADLEKGGLRRGSAWAAAHVGVELLLDGTLVADERAGALYLRALRGAEHHLVYDGAGDASRVAHLLDRLRAAGIPYPYADPRTVATRVQRALLARPRLALDGRHVDVLMDVLDDVAADVRVRAGALLDHVRRGVAPAR